MHKDYTKARRSIVRTVINVGRFVVEHERAGIPGAFSDPAATQCWTVLARSASQVRLPGLLSGATMEVVASSYVSQEDALAKARAK